MKNPLIWIVGLIIILALGFYALQNMQPAETADAPIPVEPEGFETGGPSETNQTVRYEEDGFSPATITVPVGTTVTFVNASSREMWVGSDEHPSHTGYDGTSRSEHCAEGATPSFDQCGRTDTYSFTFTKAGTFDYHDHVNAQYRGTVTVTE
jgi:plastocyanin